MRGPRSLALLLALAGLLLAADSARADLRILVASPGQTLPGDTLSTGGAAAPSAGDTLVATFKLDEVLPDGFNEGPAASLTLAVELRRARKPFWSSGRVGLVVFVYRFRRDPLNDGYEVLTPVGRLVKLDSRQTLRRYLERVHEVALATRGSLDREREYYVSVTAIFRPSDIDSVDDWLSGQGKSGVGGFLLGLPKFLVDASAKWSGLGEERAEARSGDFTPWPRASGN